MKKPSNRYYKQSASVDVPFCSKITIHCIVLTRGQQNAKAKQILSQNPGICSVHYVQLSFTIKRQKSRKELDV